MFKGLRPSSTKPSPPSEDQSFEFVASSPSATTSANGPLRSSNKEINRPQHQTQRAMGASHRHTQSHSMFNFQHLTKRAHRDDRNVDHEPLSGDVSMHDAFDKMLEDLQIPVSLRPKLQGLDSPVKAAMVKSNQVLNLHGSSPTPALDLEGEVLNPPKSTPSLRRTQSSGSLEVPRRNFDSRPMTPTFASPSPTTHFNASRTDIAGSGISHSRGVSLDIPRSFSRSQIALASPTVKGAKEPPAKLNKEKNAAAAALRDLTPAKFSDLLAKTPSTELPVEKLRKLRIMLRNEHATWSEAFIIEGGYSCLLARLNEMLEVEWRDEQRDDAILHELLRCLKALSTSSIGCFALRSSCPRPFVQLASLLYSDKKPGDVYSRQLIIELFHICLELYPTSPSVASPTVPYANNPASSTATLIMSPVPPAVSLPAPHTSSFSLLRAILLTPKPLPSEILSAPVDPHAFIAQLHQPRIFKVYLQELSDICRDYFWVFCHPNNTIWRLDDVDIPKVEAPKAPGGMTGGVEFEAMGYLSAHFRFINAVAKAASDLRLPPENEQSSFKFHTDLFLSGFERIIMISRKASTTYYPTLHLEISRYVALARAARVDLPSNIMQAIGFPPTNVIRGLTTRSNGSPTTGTHKPRDASPGLGKPTVRGASGTASATGAPLLPAPRFLDEIRF